jgi:hypothetical protein
MQLIYDEATASNKPEAEASKFYIGDYITHV